MERRRKLRVIFATKGVNAIKEFKLRICSEVPEATSEAVSGWLEEALKTGTSLAADPVGWEAFCNLSLDDEKVADLAEYFSRHDGGGDLFRHRFTRNSQYGEMYCA
jgi:hypothetical protein